MTTYTTTCLDWLDGDWDTEAESPMDAAVKHATDGWENDENAESKREPVVVRVTDSNDAAYNFLVSWSVEVGPSATEVF